MSSTRYLLAPVIASALFSPSLSAEAWLPLFAHEAIAKGYELPKPFGVSLGAMHVEQGIEVDSIGFNGLNHPLFPNRPLADDAIDISAEPGEQQSQVYSLRADAWILPFLNVYAIAGKMSGYTETRVHVNKINIFPLPPLTDGLPVFDFRLDLDGYLYGGGIVIAGGVGNWFTLIDASITHTRLTVIDGNIEAFVLSPRLGYDFSDRGVPLRVWVGGMYQEVEQHLSGYISDLDLGPKGNQLIKLVDVKGQARFDVEQHLTTPWNTLVGFQYQVNKDWSVLGEAGFGGRKSAMLSLEYRF
ncbi:virulence protein [Shewanella sp. NIFS-20-20]|uniref:virulence protein n=1 Tax=Shewanella sp. NIFS-20-20 TaxID=2853806 RepID=UPI001C45F3D9|nr:virulence protein [Shewanella sp. NIFS-20-20]MBV7316239.1 virulence protein [Shewanella sp. NIFS-20-20]